MERPNETRLNMIAGWPKLRAAVLKAEPRCTLQLAGCTGRATCIDHIIPRADAPHLTMARSNLRSSCGHCNSLRGAQMQAAKRQALAMQTAQRQARAAKPTPWQVERFFSPRH
jgi:5-methylcytosine-specific restriction endonuclease McrA